MNEKSKLRFGKWFAGYAAGRASGFRHIADGEEKTGGKTSGDAMQCIPGNDAENGFGFMPLGTFVLEPQAGSAVRIGPVLRLMYVSAMTQTRQKAGAVRRSGSLPQDGSDID